MKRLLSTLLLSLTLICGFAQEAVYAKSTTLKFGVKDRTGEFVWGEPKYVEGIYIKITKTTIDITSKKHQHYTVYSESDDVEGYDATFWYAYDLDGQKCRIYLIQTDLGEDFLAVEYNDYAWIYNLIGTNE